MSIQVRFSRRGNSAAVGSDVHYRSGNMSTGESNAAEQARLRRERRENKILAQGNSRLEKIAGLQGGATARETLHPEPTSTRHPAVGPVADRSGEDGAGRADCRFAARE